jgi:23S rRNA (cytidine1920-2'-O)/16S rRNA (cytidine1409-2'-O)-methyltransferase
MMLIGVRRRLDAEIVRRGLTTSRTEAQEAIRAGLVTVGGRPATKTSMMVEEAEPLVLATNVRRFVSRGGEKLDAALGRFGVDLAGLGCLDAGASTGGFTDCLLQRGAAWVAAVDVGYGQLAWELRNDPRVTVLERTNVRSLTVEQLPSAPGLVVADLSFISLRTVLPVLSSVSAVAAGFVLLVKPQFESRRQDVGKKGVVRDPEAWRSAITGVAEACEAAGLAPAAVMPSPLLGPAGNVEFLLHAVRGGPVVELDISSAVQEGGALR